MTRPTRCQLCGFSSRYTRQQPGETLEYMACCHAWMCAQCRIDRGCTGHCDTPDDPNVKRRPGHGIPVNDGIYSTIPDTVYHSDTASLSASGAKLLTSATPAEYIEKLREPPDPKPAFDFGHAVHKMVLGEGQQLAVLDPAVHGLTKDGQPSKVPAATALWKQADAAARDAGKLPITKANMDIAQRMAGKVFEHPIASRLLSAGVPELSGYWHDDATGIRLRFRPDFLPDLGGLLLIVDYKSLVSADPRVFGKRAMDFGYHQQAAWYLDGLAEVMGVDDAAFIFVCQTKTAPFLVSVIQLDPDAIALGRRQNRAAIDLYARCVAERDWPGYGDGIYTASLPSWAVGQIEAALDAA